MNLVLKSSGSRIRHLGLNPSFVSTSFVTLGKVLTFCASVSFICLKWFLCHKFVIGRNKCESIGKPLAQGLAKETH